MEDIDLQTENVLFPVLILIKLTIIVVKMFLLFTMANICIANVNVSSERRIKVYIPSTVFQEQDMNCIIHILTEKVASVHCVLTLPQDHIFEYRGPTANPYHYGPERKEIELTKTKIQENDYLVFKDIYAVRNRESVGKTYPVKVKIEYITGGKEELNQFVRDVKIIKGPPKKHTPNVTLLFLLPAIGIFCGFFMFAGLRWFVPGSKW